MVCAVPAWYGRRLCSACWSTACWPAQSWGGAGGSQGRQAGSRAGLGGGCTVCTASNWFRESWPACRVSSTDCTALKAEVVGDVEAFGELVACNKYFEYLVRKRKGKMIFLLPWAGWKACLTHRSSPDWAVPALRPPPG